MIQFSKNIKIFLLLTAFLLVPDFVLAAPSVSGVSGTVTNGLTVIVSGSGFGVKSPAAPLVWADFSSGIDPSSLGQKTSWDGNDNMVYSTSLPAGAGTTNGVVGTWDSTASQRAFDLQVNQNNFSEIYNYTKTYYTNTSSPNMKFWRLWPSTQWNDFVASTSQGGICLNEIDTSSPDRYQGVSFTVNTWDINEYYWKYSGGTGKYNNGSSSTYSGIWDYTKNGVVFQHMESVNNDGGYGNTQNNLVDGAFTDSADLLPDGSKLYMTSVYVDTTLAHVIVGNAATLAASSHREIQIPTAWNANGQSITATVNQGSFANGSTAYLYVVDGSGNVSNGQQITFGSSGTSDTTPPAAPSGLSVI